MPESGELERRILGASGLEVSRLTLGAMTFGGQMPPISKVDISTAHAMLEREIDAGVNLVDTADAYSGGESEQILAPVLARYRDDLLVATKIGFGSGADRPLGPKQVASDVEASLRRLGTDRIDVLYLHRPDRSTPIDDTFQALERFVSNGEIGTVGVSNWSAGETGYAVGYQRARSAAEPTSVQVYWSLVGRDVEHEIVPTCRRLGLGVVVWSPLAAGYLRGRQDGRRATYPFPPVDEHLGPRVLTAVERVAEEAGTTAAAVSLAWLLHREEVTSVIVGASSMTQLEDNLSASTLALSSEQLEALDAASTIAATYPRWWDQAMGLG